MIQLFRNFFKSKVGIVATLAFLALIAVAFASSDVANNATFGGVSGGDRVAVVGDRKLGTAELSMNATNALDQARQNDPRITMQAFIENGGLENVLEQMLDRSALAEFGRRHGLRAGDRLVDSEILQIPSFRGADGSFDSDAFQAILRQQGLTESAVREDLSMGLFARQLLTPVSQAASVPQSFARRYAMLLGERRHGTISVLPSIAYAPEGDPTPAQLQAFYARTRTNYIRPERRVIRYAAFGDEALGDLRAPTDAEIAARYRRDAAQYAASERRMLTQLVVPTQAAAQAIVEEVRGGRSLAAAAQAKGLATTQVGPVTRQQMASNSSAAVAQAAFSAAEGAIAAPARGGLGWYVLRIDDIERTAARSLEQARGEISAQLAQEQRRDALADLTARIEEEFDGGSSLADVAGELGLELSRTRPATADGRIYGTDDAQVDALLAPVVSVAFEMEEGEPQLAEVQPGVRFLVFDVADITQSSTAPLSEIRDDVEALWRRDRGAAAAREAADRVIARLRAGQSIAAAMRAEEKTLPPSDAVNMSRTDLSQQGQVPPVLALFFSMAEGTVKRLEAPGDNGWFVVQLDDIEPGEVSEDDPLIAATMQQLGPMVGEEYAQQFVAAVKREVTVERNQVAIDAVKAQLTGQTNN